MMHNQPPVPYGGMPVPAHAAANLPGHYHPVPLGYQHYQEQESSFDPIKILWLLVHYRWLIAAFVLAGLMFGVVTTWMQTPLYRAATQIELSPSGSKVIQDLEIFAQAGSNRELETMRIKMVSRELSRRVVYALNLSEQNDFLAPKTSFSLKNVFRRAFGLEQGNPLENTTPEQRERIAVARVQGGLTANFVRGTNIVNVSYVHPDPKYTALVVNQLAKSFVEQGVETRAQDSGLARDFIQQQVADTKSKLEESEKRLLSYAREQGITITGEDGGLIASNLNQVNSLLAKAIDDRLLAERDYTQVKDGNAEALPQIYNSQSVTTARSRITELRATYQEKLATLKPGFPEMRRLQAQINELTRQVAREIQALSRSVEISYEQSLKKEAQLREELRKLEAEQAAFQEKNIEYTILKREVDSNRSQYESLISKLNEVGIGSEIKTANASIIQAADVPGGAFHPRMSINLAVALSLAGVLAGVSVFALELMNNTFAVPDQVESDLNIPVLGILPAVPEDEIAEQLDNNGSALSEAYRTLRTSLQFAGTEGTVSSLMITSSAPSETKSSTIFKLAKEFSALGRSVLIIDADMRKPRMHRLLGMDNGIGLSNLLTNVVKSGDVSEMFRKIPGENITFLCAGTIPPNPSDLLASEKMGLTIHLCKKKYDMVLVDAPPVMGLADAPILSRNVDGVLLMVSCKQVPRKAAKQALKRLREAGANVLGAAVSKFSVSKVDYNYAYRYMNYSYYTYDDADKQKQIGHYGDEEKSWSFGFASNWANRISGRFGKHSQS